MVSGIFNHITVNLNNHFDQKEWQVGVLFVENPSCFQSIDLKVNQI